MSSRTLVVACFAAAVAAAYSQDVFRAEPGLAAVMPRIAEVLREEQRAIESDDSAHAFMHVAEEMMRDLPLALFGDMMHTSPPGMHNPLLLRRPGVQVRFIMSSPIHVAKAKGHHCPCMRAARRLCPAEVPNHQLRSSSHMLGGEARLRLMRCMLTHVDELPDRCAHAVRSSVLSRCSGDVEKLCPVQKHYGHLHRCLGRQREQLSESCAAYFHEQHARGGCKHHKHHGEHDAKAHAPQEPASPTVEGQDPTPMPLRDSRAAAAQMTTAARPHRRRHFLVAGGIAVASLVVIVAVILAIVGVSRRVNAARRSRQSSVQLGATSTAAML